MTDPFAPPPPGAAPVPAPATPYSAPQPPPGFGPPQGGPPQGAPLYGAPLPTGQRNGFGTAALVLGLIGFLTGGVFVLPGVLALIFGLLGRGRAKRGEASNGGLALAGVILGILGILASIAVYVFVAFLLNSDSFTKYRDCMDQAGSNENAKQACSTQFGHDLVGDQTS